jgi:translation elongation factor EF-G
MFITYILPTVKQFVRVYSGELLPKQQLQNNNQHCTEKPMLLYQVHADEYKTVTSITAGQVSVTCIPDL